MPDFGLTEALANALKASKSVEVMRPAETKLAEQAAKTAPAAAAPTVPASAPTPAPAARALSVQAPPAEPPPGSVQAPPVNPSVQPGDIPPPQAADAASTPAAVPATPDVATSSDGAPAVPASPEAPVAPAATPPDPTVVAPANKLPPPPEAPPRPSIFQTAIDQQKQAAERFVTANLGDLRGKIDMTHMPNVNVMQSPDGVKAAVLQIAADNRDLVESARGTAATHDQLLGLAQDLSINTDTLQQVFDREFGAVADPAAGDQRRGIVLAARAVEQNSAGNLISLSDRVATGAATSDDIIQWHQYRQATLDWITRLSGVKAEAGRDLNALGIHVDNTLPSAVRDHIAGVLKQNNPDIQATAAAIRLAGTPSGVASIVSGMANIPLWNRALIKAPFNLLQRVFINGILSGPQTWAKIFVGNNTNLALNTFDLFAAGIGRGMVGLAARLGGWPTASEGATISDAMAHVHGVISGSADALRVAGRVLKSGQSLDGIMRAQEDFGRNTTQGILPELQGTFFGGIAHALDTAIGVPGRVIGAVDDFTKTFGYRGYVTMMSLKEIRARVGAGTLRPGDAEQTMLDMMKNTSPEIAQAAEDWAHRMTFQSPFPEGGVGEAFQNVLNKAPALRFIFPFMRTATNIFKQSLAERTPLAMFSARLRAQIANGGFEGDLAKSRIATGTAIGSMLAWMSIHDRMTGDAPKDPKQRAEWELDGRQPYSIRVTDPISGKDSWRSYTWFEPMATLAGVVADSVQLHAYINGEDDANSMLDHDARLSDARAHIMASIIQNTGNKTFMQGAAQFSEMYNDPQRAFGMWFDQVGASMVPFSGAAKFARNEQDPFLRQAFTLIDKIRDELPTTMGVKGSKTLPARLDVFGEPRKTTYGNAILGPLNPLPGSPDVHDELTSEIQRIMETTRTVPLTMPSQQLALMGSGQGLQGGTGMRLTPQEYNEYTRMSRSDPIFNGGKQPFRERLEQAIASPVYQQATAADQGEILKNIQHTADKIGADRLFHENPDFAERMTEWTAEKNRLKFGQ